LPEADWQAEVIWAGEMLFLGSDRRGHTVVYDSGEEGLTSGIGPMRALLTSLGACTGMDIVAILRKRKQKVSSLRVLVRGERPESGYPRPFKAIELKYLISGEDLKREQVEEAVSQSMEKFCHVAATLRPSAKISHSYEILSDSPKP
jgi:putative redox protein